MLSSLWSLFIAILFWLMICAWMDWKQRTVSNWLTIPPICLAILFRLLGLGTGSFQEILAITLILAVAWSTHLAGGADIKAILAVTILNPAFAAWAWGGAIVIYFLLRLARKKTSRFPGMIGFFVGLLTYGLWSYLG